LNYLPINADPDIFRRQTPVFFACENSRRGKNLATFLVIWWAELSTLALSLKFFTHDIGALIRRAPPPRRGAGGAKAPPADLRRISALTVTASAIQPKILENTPLIGWPLVSAGIKSFFNLESA
jgi:hypothetical protein